MAAAAQLHSHTGKWSGTGCKGSESEIVRPLCLLGGRSNIKQVDKSKAHLILIHINLSLCPGGFPSCPHWVFFSCTHFLHSSSSSSLPPSLHPPCLFHLPTTWIFSLFIIFCAPSFFSYFCLCHFCPPPPPPHPPRCSSGVRHYQPNDPDVTLMLTQSHHNCFCVLCLYVKQQNMYFVLFFCFFSKAPMV